LTWDGSREELYPQEKLSIVEAVREKIGLANTLFVGGVTFDEELDIPHAVASARVADAVVACVGEPPYCETPGNIDDLTLSDPQLKLVRELAATGKPIVLVLVQGRPRVIRSIVDEVPGIIMAYLPGVEGGRAIADVLFGDVNPSGKLPFTYPRYPGGFKWYDHKQSEETSPNRFDPQWEFGHGLSYSPVTYRALRTDQSILSPDQMMAVMVDVTNTGNRPCKEIVQLFLTDEVASVTPPVKALKRFKKVDLLAKQTDTVRFELTWDDLAFIGRDNRPVVEPGQFQVRIGGLSVSFEAR
jgi:beta-glucosidase